MFDCVDTMQSQSTKEQAMKTISIEYTEIKYPNIYARGVVAIHTVMKRGVIYTINERANGKMDKPRVAFNG